MNRIGPNSFNAAVPGGRDNVAAGYTALAAGRRAKATNDGCFVWADHTDADFASTASDQFLIRAAGGVGIGTTSPVPGSLTVNGDIVITNATGAYRGNIGPNHGAPFPRPAYDSGWTNIPCPPNYITITHNVGGDVEKYFVDMQMQHDSYGISTRYLGVEWTPGGNAYGNWYWKLTSGDVEVWRASFGGATNVRLRIWVYN